MLTLAAWYFVDILEVESVIREELKKQDEVKNG